MPGRVSARQVAGATDEKAGHPDGPAPEGPSRNPTPEPSPANPTSRRRLVPQAGNRAQPTDPGPTRPPHRPTQNAHRTGATGGHAPLAGRRQPPPTGRDRLATTRHFRSAADRGGGRP